MNYRTMSVGVGLLILFTLSSQYKSARSLCQESSSTAKKGFFAILPYYHSRNYPRTGCHPVEVKLVSIGAYPPEVLTSQVVIESFSDKPVASVKLRWDVYSRSLGRKKATARCDVTPEPGEVFLSGTTQPIQVGHLANGELCNITSILGATVSFATKNIFVDQPIIAWDQVKSLTLDGTRATFKGEYGAIIYVSEVQFEDGTKWEGGVK